MDVRDLRADDAASLSNEELERAASMRWPADRDLRVAAAALLRRAVARETGHDPRSLDVDRSCPRCGEQHWRPRLRGLDIHVSVTHGGTVAGVALTRAGAVGLDVEAVAARDILSIRQHVLAEGECATTAADLYRYWTRKEAVVKATGDGIGAGLHRVVVSGPHQAPRLLAYPDRPELPARLVDLQHVDGYVASVAVLTTRPLRVTQCWCR